MDYSILKLKWHVSIGHTLVLTSIFFLGFRTYDLNDLEDQEQ